MSRDPDLSWDKRPLTARDFALTVLAGVILLAVVVGLSLSRLQPPQQGQPSAPAEQAQVPTPGSIPAASAQAEQGAALFESHCVSCHTLGGGKLVGPDLAGVTDRRDPAWLQRWILAPDRVLAEGDPIAQQLFQEFNKIPMPNLGLTQPEAEALIAYFQSAGEQPAVAVQPPVSQPEGDPGVGRLLFLGADRFENGGPPCMACHSVAGIGALGGGALGPDLTQVLSKYGGPQGLDAFLDGVPTPTMNAVWVNRPLSAQERADLIAFFQAAAVQERAPQTLQLLAALAVGGAAIPIAIAGLVWRRRLSPVRRSLLRRPV